MFKPSETGCCSDLKLGQRCIRLWKYHNGNGVVIFHEHIATRRMSLQNCHDFMIALLLRESELPESELLRFYLNNRNGKPSKLELFNHSITYPCRGVLRRSIDGHRISAFCDEYVMGGK